MNKKIIILFILVLICRAGYSQKNVNQLFNEFSKHTTTKVSLGKLTMTFAGIFSDTMGVDGIEVLSFDSCDQDVKEQFTEAIKKMKDSSFETMVNANEDGNRTKVMVRIEEETIRELVVLVSGVTPAMVRIKGNIKKSDIEKLVSQHS